jgi:hypothetical protein
MSSCQLNLNYLSYFNKKHLNNKYLRPHRPSKWTVTTRGRESSVTVKKLSHPSHSLGSDFALIDPH